MHWELVLARPAALLALALPACVLALARFLERPRREATGSVRLWRALASEAPGARGARGPIPLSIWCFAAALALAAFALSGPELETADAARTFVAVVDRSPGMHLPLEAGEPGAPGAARTRLAEALALAQAHIRENARAADRVRWESPERDALVLAPGEVPPEAWLAPDPWYAPRPAFEARDVPGALWISDRARAARRASVFASGGADVPGPLGERGDESGGENDAESSGERDVRLVVWEGGDSVAERPVPARRARLVAPSEAEFWRELLASWCGARGLELEVGAPSAAAPCPAPTASGAEELALCVRVTERAGAGAPVAVGRDGWRLAALAGELPELDAPVATVHTWLATPESEPRALVRAAPGRLALAFHPQGMPEGDPAAFAVSWARLFDEVLLPRPGAVPLEFRSSAGERVARAGELPADEGPSARPPPPLTAWCAALAGLAALAAAGSVWRESRRS